MRFDGFDWDFGNLKKAQTHGLSIDEIETFFQQKLLIVKDSNHGKNERRWIAVGLSTNERPMFVSYTFRKYGSNLKIKVISARYMHKKEVLEFEKLRENIKKT
jgi:uncharacterized DUF497 family protein